MVNELNIKFEGNMSRIYHPNQMVACKFGENFLDIYLSNFVIFSVIIELRLDKLIKKAKGENFNREKPKMRSENFFRV